MVRIRNAESDAGRSAHPRIVCVRVNSAYPGVLASSGCRAARSFDVSNCARANCARTLRSAAVRPQRRTIVATDAITRQTTAMALRRIAGHRRTVKRRVERTELGIGRMVAGHHGAVALALVRGDGRSCRGGGKQLVVCGEVIDRLPGISRRRVASHHVLELRDDLMLGGFERDVRRLRSALKPYDERRPSRGYLHGYDVCEVL